MWESVLGAFPMPPGVEPLPAAKPIPPRFDVAVLPHDAPALPALDSSVPLFGPQAKYATHSAPHCATVVANTRLTADEWEQNVRHIELDIEGSEVTYDAGDVAAILAENTDQEVRATTCRDICA